MKEPVRRNKPHRSYFHPKVNYNVETKRNKVDKKKYMILTFRIKMVREKIRAKIGAFLWFAAYLHILPKELEAKMINRNEKIQLAFSSCIPSHLNVQYS